MAPATTPSTEAAATAPMIHLYTLFIYPCLAMLNSQKTNEATQYVTMVTENTWPKAQAAHAIQTIAAARLSVMPPAPATGKASSR